MPNSKSFRRKVRSILYKGKKRKKPAKRYAAVAQVPKPTYIPTSLQPISSTRNVTLRFREFRSNTLAANMDDWRYVWTDIYDPYHPAGGGSPLYFVDMCAMYNHWTVIGATLTATFVQTSTAVAAACGVITTAGTTTQTDHMVLQARQRSSVKIMSPTNKKVVIKQSFNPKRFFGPSWKAGSSLYRGTGNGTSPPTENAYAHVCMQSLDQASTISYVVNIAIDFNVHFSEPIAQS